MSLKTPAKRCIGLGLVSTLALVVAHLALTDIYHAEGDLTWERNVVRVLCGRARVPGVCLRDTSQSGPDGLTELRPPASSARYFPCDARVTVASLDV
jgi:hypothetical protein